MRTKLLLDSKILSTVIDKVHEENLPIKIDTGEKKGGLTDVLFEYPDTFQSAFEPMMETVFNEAHGPMEGDEL